jgi:hypothetical protein
MTEQRSEPLANHSLFARLLKGWRAITYQLVGPKMNRRVAYFDPARITDPRAWLEKHLELLQLYEDNPLQPGRTL